MIKSKVAKNASWIIISKIIQSLLGLIISMLTARYLGPSNYGTINYAASLASFVLPIMQLGFNSVLVQELTNYPEQEGEIMGSTIFLSFLSSLVCISGITIFSVFVNADEFTTMVVCVLYSAVLIFQAFDLIEYWFQAKLLSKYTSLVSVCAYIVVSVYKIFLLISNKDIYWFAVSTSLDYLIISVSLLWIYNKQGGKRLRFSANTAKRIFRSSKYYIVSGLMVTIYAQTDKIMLKLMVDETATGLYSAAVACAGMTSFVFSAIIDSMRPVIFQHKKNNNVVSYEISVIRLYSVVIFLAVVQSLFISLFARPIINILFGTEYLTSVATLRIIIWYTTFSYFGGAKDIWMLAENKQKYLIWLNLAGACANIILNYLLIPVFGISGAAIASLFTQVFTNVIMMALIRPLRRNWQLLLKALNPKGLSDFLHDIISK